MASANLDLVQSIHPAWERGDFSSVESAHPEIECVSDEPVVPLDAAGIAELGGVWGSWLHAWDGFHIDADGCHEVDGVRVLALVRYGGRDRLRGQGVVPTEAATLFPPPRRQGGTTRHLLGPQSGLRRPWTRSEGRSSAPIVCFRAAER